MVVHYRHIREDAEHFGGDADQLRPASGEDREKYAGWLRLVIWFCSVFVFGGLIWGSLFGAVV